MVTLMEVHVELYTIVCGMDHQSWWPVSGRVTFANPNAPVYPRLAQGKMWNEMTVTWAIGYALGEATPFVKWGQKGGELVRSPAGTLTFDSNNMCVVGKESELIYPRAT